MILGFIGFCHKSFAAPPPQDDEDCLSALVELEATAADYRVARTTALAEGEQLALAEVAERLSLGEYQGEVLASVLPLRLRLRKEVFDRPNYRAVGEWCFAAKAVRKALTAAGVAHLTAPPPPVLLLPVLRQGGLNKLWEGDNLWRRVWQRTSRPIVRVILPEGGLADKGLLSARQALAGDERALAALMKRYDADSALVAIMNEDVMSLGFLHLRSDLSVGELNGAVFRVADFEQATAVTLAGLEEGLRMQLFRPIATTAEFPATACFRDLEGWRALRAAVKKTPGVMELQLNWLARHRAAVLLRANAAPDELLRQLAATGITAEFSEAESSEAEFSGTLALNCPLSRLGFE